MTEASDSDVRDLLDRLLRHEPRAWRELVAGYTGLLMAVIRRTFGRYGAPAPEMDVEDLVAEVWRNLLAHDLRLVRQCRRHGRLLQTLHVLARNRTVDFLRRRQWQTTPLDENTLPDTAPATETPEATPPPQALSAALAALSARERTVIGLFFLQDKSYREIAALTGIPQNSIGPTLGRALAKLRAALQAPP